LIKKCKVCGEPAFYKIYRTKDGKKEFIDVCVDCEIKIGDENIKRSVKYAERN